ncbi:MAG: hypothetical protein GTO02_11060 [Candidatus Dadabacteria bacterium]|nr:hypothetical protein [Candidatus Dadabacteria bacterium]NIQ14902.1 hypothetical protein [Candidatus Dadabacteria bacterium]
MLIFVFLGVNSFASNFFPLTSSQKHFTAIVKGLPGVVTVDWKTPVSLWIKVSKRAIGFDGNVKKADSLAEILAERGRTALYQPFCVHIYQKSNEELASECVY